MKKRLVAMLLAVLMLTCTFVQAASATTYRVTTLRLV